MAEAMEEDQESAAVVGDIYSEELIKEKIKEIKQNASKLPKVSIMAYQKKLTSILIS